MSVPLVLATILAACNIALAGPEGFFYAEGTYADGTPYSGSVSVVRTGETYRVLWKLTDGEYRGTGIGGAPSEGSATIGPASDDDEILTIGYWGGYEDDVGVAVYMAQPDGTWYGIWNEYGSHKVSYEIWTPIPPVIDQESLEY